ncbi:hypothetical protein [Pandoraea communis]|uniref:hypothetical protein n=1 Tax=Pandoraea communis TaxID=2508297 RepID=UPI0012424122|nr:hypothetical protein [Pandoraea communis]
MNFDEIFFLIEIILKSGVKATARDPCAAVCAVCWRPLRRIRNWRACGLTRGAFHNMLIGKGMPDLRLAFLFSIIS